MFSRYQKLQAGPDNIDVIYNVRIKELRKKYGYTALQVAGYLGIPRPTYSCYEAPDDSPSKREAPIEVLVKLANLYGVSVDYILGVTENPATHDNAIDIEYVIEKAPFDDLTKEYAKKIMKAAIEENSAAQAM